MAWKIFKNSNIVSYSCLTASSKICPITSLLVRKNLYMIASIFFTCFHSKFLLICKYMIGLIKYKSNWSLFLICRDNESSEQRASRLDNTRAAARLATEKWREQLSPEQSQEEKEKNTRSRAESRQVLSEDQKTEIRRKDADAKRTKANQR